MKKQLVLATAVLFTAGTLLFTGCKKDDTTPPTVTMNGGDMTISLQDNYTEMGATATDDEDGELTVTTSGTVNEDLVGTYTITYTATDAAGNVGTATRYVTVRNDADIYAGTYTTSNPDFGTASPWTQTITASTTINNRVVFSEFAARTGNNTIEANLVGGNTFVLVDKTVTGLGTNACDFRYTNNGAGAPITQTGGKYTFTVKYFEERLAGTGACTAVAPTAFTDTFVQQ